jgi:hypothetical protein
MSGLASSSVLLCEEPSAASIIDWADLDVRGTAFSSPRELRYNRVFVHDRAVLQNYPNRWLWVQQLRTTLLYGAALFDVGVRVHFIEHNKNNTVDHISYFEDSDFNSLWYSHILIKTTYNGRCGNTVLLRTFRSLTVVINFVLPTVKHCQYSLPILMSKTRGVQRKI